MYEAYFGLQEAPFTISPDPRFFFLSSQHKECLAKCQYAVKQRMGLAVIYGEVGTGKTTIARRLVQAFSDQPDYKTAMIISPGLRTENALLREIMKEFAVQTKRSFADSRAAFQAFLVEQFVAKRTVVLMIDEAQTIKSANFELIRALLNFETDQQKLLNIILLGQSELARKLDARPELKSRVTIFGALSSLSRDDTEKMLRFRWQVSGGADMPFDGPAIDAVLRYTRGLPRMICTLANTSLTKAFMRKRKVVDESIVSDASVELRMAARPIERSAA